VSFLARQAKKSARDLANKQKTLINYYKMKEDRFEEHQRVAEVLFRCSNGDRKRKRIYKICEKLINCFEIHRLPSEGRYEIHG
jgi:hypothetical protein